MTRDDKELNLKNDKNDDALKESVIDNHFSLNKYDLGSIVIFSTAFASFLMITYHSGWLLRAIDVKDLWSIILLDICMPIAFFLLSAINYQIKQILLICIMILFIISIDYLVLNLPNLQLPKDMALTSFTTIIIFLAIGSSISITSISFAGLLNLKWISRANLSSLLIGVIISFIITFTFIYTSLSGWLNALFPSLILLPSGIMIYIITSNAAPREIKNAKDYIQKVKLDAIQDRTRWFKHFLLVLLTSINLLLILGLSGIHLKDDDYALKNSYLYLSSTIGAIAALVFTILIIRPKKEVSKVEHKNKTQYFLIHAAACNLILPIIVFWLNINDDDYHGSLLGVMIDGMIFGFVLLNQVLAILILHPPKHHQVYFMLIFLIISLIIVFGSYIKAIPVKPGELVRTGNSIMPYLMGMETILSGLIIMNSLITLLKGKKIQQNMISKRNTN
ncbi:MAG: hypothetical protein ACTSVI_06350 [Promethearchaeota archaeon]